MQEGSDDFLLEEWKQAISSYHSTVTLMVQSWGFLIAGEAILLGYGVSSRHAVLFVVATTLSLVMIATYRRFLAHAFSFASIAIRIESALRGNGETTLMAHYFLAHYTEILLSRINRAYGQLPESEPRTKPAIGFASRDGVIVLEPEDLALPDESMLPWTFWTPVMRLMGVLAVAQGAFSILAITVWNYPFP